jgi:DNA-directed RNA polymerase subunit delta
MKRIIVDYSKLTNEILNLLVDKFPDGYDDSNIIRFRNHKDEAIEAVEVKTDDTIYLVKISTKLSERMFNYDEDDEIEEVPEIDAKSLDLDEDSINENDDDEDEKEDKPEFDEDDDDEDSNKNEIADDEDEDDEDL